MLASFAGSSVGCRRGGPAADAPTKPPEVLVTSPVTRSVTEYEEFTGRAEAVRTVDIRARVTGYLNRVLFKEGGEVRENDVLFEIDPRTYQAEADRAAATVNQADARQKRSEADFQRAQSMARNNSISAEEYDRIIADRAEAAAGVGVARASLEVARLNLGFTQVRSPVSGRVSRANVDPGNLVKADDTLLTTIVTTDPMYAYFDVDERTLLRLRRMVREGKIRSSRETSVPVEMALTDEDGFRNAGTIDFVDNRLTADTGTLRVRGVFPNPNGLLSPGLFVRVRMPVGQPRDATLIPEQALATDQGQKFVYVVDDKNVVQYRRVKVGPQQESLRVIEHGVGPGDRVVVAGLQRIRPGVTVDPKPAEAAARATTGRSAGGTQ
jgi:multidrug efflux system membrane fusion protein